MAKKIKLKDDKFLSTDNTVHNHNNLTNILTPVVNYTLPNDSMVMSVPMNLTEGVYDFVLSIGFRGTQHWNVFMTINDLMTYSYNFTRFNYSGDYYTEGDASAPHMGIGCASPQQHTWNTIKGTINFHAKQISICGNFVNAQGVGFFGGKASTTSTEAITNLSFRNAGSTDPVLLTSNLKIWKREE